MAFSSAPLLALLAVVLIQRGETIAQMVGALAGIATVLALVVPLLLDRS